MPVDGEEEDVKPAVLKRKKKKKRTPAQPVDGAQMNPEQAVDALNANELAAKRLRKKYFVEAIKFVRELDIATGHIQLLLGSTSKAEVLEAMDYFQTAHALQVTNAEVDSLTLFILTMCSLLCSGRHPSHAPSHLDQG